MAATSSTNNKLRNIRNVLYWSAQYSDCPYCKKPLVNNNRLVASEVYNLTADHISGAYDHKRRKDKSPKGTRLMHRTCHKQFTAKSLGLGKHKRK